MARRGDKFGELEDRGIVSVDMNALGALELQAPMVAIGGAPTVMEEKGQGQERRYTVDGSQHQYKVGFEGRS